jgi:hypothetical protein
VTNQGIFIFAAVVFTLMTIGLGLTILEFRASMADMRMGAADSEAGRATSGES